MKPTIHDVAREAGVSRGTVDRVLNKKGSVSSEAERKVNEAIEKLNYKRSPVASARALHKKNIKIGILYPDVDHFFWKEVNKGIREAKARLDSLGVELLVRTTKNYDYRSQLKCLDEMQQQKVNGIVTMSYHYNKTNDKIKALYDVNIPVVTFLSDAPDSKRLAYIGVNSHQSGIVAAKMMGFRTAGNGNIVVIGVHRDLLCMEERLKGFMSKIESEYPELKILETYNMTEYRKEEEKFYKAALFETVAHILEKHPDMDALYTTSMTGSAAQAIKNSNINRKIILIGHENTEEIRGLMKRGYIDATVYENQHEEIIRAIDLIYKYIKDGEIEYSALKPSPLGILIKENIE
jgi:LacI family transcriptional regulator